MTEAAWPLIGHASAERIFLDAFACGKLHHGWLIEGPSGIGKAQLARRIAAFMLGAKGRSGAQMDAGPGDPVVQKLQADAHPDLRWLARRPDEKGKIKQDIPVDDVRALNHFFSLKSAMGGWRVGVIDSLDELNRNGANAMLKTLEEPPERCLLLLISHGTRSILPTIRSRCRTLRLQPLGDEETLTVLKQAGAEDPRAAAKLARGRPGLGLALASPSGMAAASAARSWLRALPTPSDSVLSQTLRTAGVDAIAFDAFASELLAWLSETAETRPDLSEAWLEMSRLLSEARALNMDRTQSAAKLIAGVGAAAPRELRSEPCLIPM